VSGSFDRWSEEEWLPLGSWLFSLDEWGGFADTAGQGMNLLTPAIALSAPVGGTGPVGYFRLQDLVEGWYRVGLQADCVGSIPVTRSQNRRTVGGLPEVW
jgi:hypothetical protein